MRFMLLKLTVKMLKCASKLVIFITSESSEAVFQEINARQKTFKTQKIAWRT